MCPRQTKECLAQLNEMEIKKICDKKVYKIYDSARKFRNVKCPHCKVRREILNLNLKRK